MPRWIGCQRFIYNGKVGEDRLFTAQRRLALRDDPKAEVRAPLDQQYAQFKDLQLSPWLFDVPSQILRNGAYRWMTAKTRQLKGLAKAPRLRNRSNFDSVLITNELFRFKRETDPVCGAERHCIEIGTAARPIGRLRFEPTQPYAEPNTIVVRRTASGKWFVSFAFEAVLDAPLRTDAEIAYELNALDDETLQMATLALDRNVRDNCFADSAGRQFDLRPIERRRLDRKEIGRRRHQKRLARQDKGSANRRKVAQRIGRSHEYAGDVRRNFAHQLSHALAADPAHRLFAFENLKILAMVRRPKAKQDPATGKWLRNGAAAKAGLNKSILTACWGRTKTYLSYKARRRGKLVVTVPPHHSSQECAACGHIHPDNRHNSRFVCQRCGFAAHADHNAGLVLRKRAVALIRSGAIEVAPTPRKRVSFRKQPSGRDTPEACSDARPMSVEPRVRRPLASNTPTGAAGDAQAGLRERSCRSKQKGLSAMKGNPRPETRSV